MCGQGFASIQRRYPCERFVQAGQRAVDGAPVPDVCHIEGFGALHGEHIAGVVEVFGAAPAEFLDDDVLGGGQPCFTLDLCGEHATPASELGLHESIIEQLEKFDFERWCSGGFSDQTFSPCEGNKLDLGFKNHDALQTAHDTRDGIAGCEAEHDIHILGGSRDAVESMGEGSCEHVFHILLFACGEHGGGELLDGHEWEEGR